MATNPEQDGDAPRANAVLGAQVPRAVRDARDRHGATSSVSEDRPAPELDVARHLVLARAALPEDPRDARPPLPDLLADDVDEGPAWLDGASVGPDADRPRAFRTRPLVLPGDAERPAAPHADPAPAAGPGPVAAVRAALDDLARGLDEARRLAARAEARLADADAGSATRPAATRTPAPPTAAATHPLAIEMAVAGFSRGEVGQVLAGQVGDPAAVARVLDEVYGPGSDAGARISG